ncbi:MAG: energy transducer TonB [Ignavibacteriaceae bacterium]|jgi:protein TonB
MKTILAILIFGFLIAGCENKSNKVEVVPNLEDMYNSINDVDTPPKETETTSKEMNKDLENAAKSLYDKNSEEPMQFNIALRFYLNEKGSIDKIRDISKPFHRLQSTSDSISVYTDRQKLSDAIAERVSNWKFDPAKIKGTPVKCWSDVKANILVNPDGTTKIEIPDFLAGANMFNPGDKYFVAVEEMPEPIGGIAAIQKNIKYPEIAKRAGIEGRVYIQAFIDENGNVTRANVLKGIGAGCDEAAMNAIKKVKFIPGRQRGIPVKVQVSVPVIFKLSDNTVKEVK